MFESLGLPAGSRYCTTPEVTLQCRYGTTTGKDGTGAKVDNAITQIPAATCGIVGYSTLFLDVSIKPIKKSPDIQPGLFNAS